MTSETIDYSIYNINHTYYESSFIEYINQIDKYNIHPELNDIKIHIGDNISQFHNLILYGPPGSGKYSQCLSIIKPYSNSKLRYEKKIYYSYDKQDKNKTQKVKKESKKIESDNMNELEDKIKKHEFMYRISDIHYEIDLSNLGCNSKYLWHDLFFQIVDIISTQQNKIGIIVCKNFHNIHNELLDIFYSYMHHPLYFYNIVVKFIIITEQYCFLPNNIVNSCKTIAIKKPSDTILQEMVSHNKMSYNYVSQQSNLKSLYQATKKTNQIVGGISNELSIFNIINNLIITQIVTIQINIIELRNNLYDLFIYGVDIYKSIWYIINSLILTNKLKKQVINNVMNNMPQFLKYYNNNYRSIYHIEHIILYLYEQVHLPE